MSKTSFQNSITCISGNPSYQTPTAWKMIFEFMDRIACSLMVEKPHATVTVAPCVDTIPACRLVVDEGNPIKRYSIKVGVVDFDSHNIGKASFHIGIESSYDGIISDVRQEGLFFGYQSFEAIEKLITPFVNDLGNEERVHKSLFSALTTLQRYSSTHGDELFSISCKEKRVIIHPIKFGEDDKKDKIVIASADEINAMKIVLRDSLNATINGERIKLVP